MRWGLVLIPLLSGCFVERGGLVSQRDAETVLPDGGPEAGQSDAGGPCIPTGAEICDGVDNDCDTSTADGSADPQIGLPCEGPDLDVCEDDAFIGCGVAGLTCSTGSDNVELCNGVDDNCDGLPDDSSVCPCRTEFYGEHVYLFCSTATTWWAARGACPSGYDLVKIDTFQEQNFIQGIAATIALTDFWVGGTDEATPGTFRWISDNSLVPAWGGGAGYENWGNIDDDGNCVELDGDMTSGPRWSWNDAPCTQSNQYICETVD